MVFLFRSEHESQIIYFFCRAKREFFFQKATLGYMTKTLNQIIFFFLHQNQNIFFSNIGNQNIFLEKDHNPPFKLNGRSLTSYRCVLLLPATFLINQIITSLTSSVKSFQTTCHGVIFGSISYFDEILYFSKIRNVFIIRFYQNELYFILA